MLIAALRFHKDSDADGAATVVELKQLLELIKADTLSFILEVRRVLQESQQTRRIEIRNSGRQRCQQTLEKEEASP